MADAEPLCAGVVLARFDGSEGEFLHALDNDAEMMRWINGGAPTERAFIDTQSLPLFVARDGDEPRLGYWKLLEDGEGGVTPVGWASLRREAAGVASLGYRLCRAVWGRGLATRVARALVDHGFDAVGLDAITATTYEENLASQRVLEKAGFVLERRYRENFDGPQTAQIDPDDAFPGFDLAYRLTRARWQENARR